MSAPPNGAQVPQTRTLSGTLAKTPMPRLLVSASTARVTGTLELVSESETATVTMVRGNVTKVKTSTPVAYLGSILYELGYIDDAELNESLRELARTKWLHGEILVTREAITPVQLAEGLHEQTTRKLVHLFSLPPSTTYTFDSDVDRLASWGGGDWPHVDPIAAVWRGVRDGFADEDVTSAMSKVTAGSFRLVAGAATKKFDLSDVEASAVECLRARPLSLDELSVTAPIDARRARVLVYFLLVTKQAEIIDTSGMRPAYRPSAAPAQPAPSPQMRPTRPEMPAPNVPPAQRPTTKFARPEPTESARWRAVAPTGYASSAKIPVAAPQVAESAKMPVAASSPPAKITMGGIEPSESASWRAAVPASGSMRSAPPASGSMRSAPPSMPSPPSKPSSGAPAAAMTPELAARKVRIFERARAILKEDYFQRLSLARDADPEQVDAAYEALRTLWDPALLPPALDEVRDDCAFVMSCLGEAHATLRDRRMRDEYVASVRMSALRAVTDQYAEDLAASGCSDPFEGAQACFARGENDRAERLARKAVKANPEAAAPLALLAWLEATKPSNASPTDTRPRIAMLDRALRLDPSMEKAWYWRGLLHKRLENHQLAMRDFKKVSELNPKNLEAVRELRLYEMRIRNNSITMKAVKPSH